MIFGCFGNFSDFCRGGKDGSDVVDESQQAYHESVVRHCVKLAESQGEVAACRKW